MYKNKMLKKILCAVLLVCAAFAACFGVHAGGVYNVWHPNWQENVKVDGDHFCRLSGDCGTVLKETADFITVKWDKWGIENFAKGISGSYDLVFEDRNYDKEIKDEYQKFVYTFKNPYVKLNPYGKTPLSLLVKFPTEKKARITFKVLGQDGQKDIVRQIPGFRLEHELEVHGLYPNRENKVEIVAHYETGNEEKRTVTFKMPRGSGNAFYTVLKKKDAKDLYYFSFDGYVVDEYGHYRYVFLPEGLIAYYLNGEVVTESRTKGLTSYNMMGKLTGKYAYPKGFVSFQHGMNVMPNGNFLVLGRKLGLTALNEGVDQVTVWDQIIELDKKTGAVVKWWDLGTILNPQRKAIARSPATAPENDWSHLNSIAYDATDESLVVSARHIGMVKIAYKDGALKWVANPHVEFDKSGRDGKGPSVWDKLLTAVDASGKPYSEKVQKGYERVPDFKWPTRNHDAKIIGDGLFSIFDNSRLVGDPSIAVTQDSNAVIYRIDPVRMTIRQMWSQPLGDYSAVGSGVTYLPKESDVVVFISEIIDPNSKHTCGKIQRYDYKTKEKLFEALLLRTGWIYRVDPFSWPE